jgi:hypothetical protein
MTLAPAHPQGSVAIDVRAHLAFAKGQAVEGLPAVLWLKPTGRTPVASFAPHPPYALLQKRKMFTPHLLVLPVGSKVIFPNADPFFHNVFSLFDGKRFDLGLYEAGSTKEVTFSREGISYIFCNIHPEMSAVVVALSAPTYAIPAGDYEMHLWVEGVQQSALDQLARSVHLTSGSVDLGAFSLPAIPQLPVNHLNKFGRQYGKEANQPY